MKHILHKKCLHVKDIAALAGNRRARETHTLTHLLGNRPHHTAATLKRVYAPPHVSYATV